MVTRQNYAAQIKQNLFFFVNLNTSMQNLQEIFKKDLIHQTITMKDHYP